jgi:flagellar assembly factor FliW
MLNCVPIKRWAIVVPVTMLKITEHYMSKVLDSTSKNLGISMSEPFYIQIENEEISSYTRELKILLNKEKPQLVFCILSCNREDRYRAIKKICSVEYGGEYSIILTN